jgi:hypothetical protein
MTTYRVRQSKPAAVFSAVFGLVVVVVGTIAAAKSGHGLVWVFPVVGAAIIGFGLWSAFSKHGALQTIESDDGTPPVPRGRGLGGNLGTVVEREDSSR